MPTAAILGAGFIAEAHAQALRSLGIAITCVVDCEESRAAAFAQRWSIPTWGSDLSLLDAADCIHICTPPSTHFVIAAGLLQKGKHLLCEKPLCLSSDEADELVSLADKAGTVCAVGFNVRYHAACRRLRELICAEDFGRVLLLHGSYQQEFGAEPARYDWRYNPQLAGQLHAVTEIGSHWFDLAEYLSGRKITAVSAQFDAFHPLRYLDGDLLYHEDREGREPIPVLSEDAAAINLRFDNGAIGCVLLSELSHGRQNRLSMEITGEKESVWWNSEQSSVLHWAKKASAVQTEQFAFSGGFADTQHGLIAAVYRAIKTGIPTEPSYPTFRDGARNVHLCAAVQKSAQRNGAWTE